VQYTKCSDNKKHLGVTSEDGSQIIEISKYKCYPNDLKQFIEKGIDLAEIKSKVDCYEPIRTDDVKLLPPLANPQKIICIGLNYRGHCDEQKIEYPSEPVFFSKFSTALIGPTDDIVAHKITTKLDWEVELGVVIGTKAHKVSRENAMDHVFGYTVANDITAREWQKRNGGQWLISKTMDKTCPIGPCVVSKTELDASNLTIRCSVNNVVKQCGKTSEFIFPIDDIISRLSQCITLVPGDLILTGTCAGVGVFRNPREFLKFGDVVECEIEGIGKLINTVVEDKSC
jgi:2-keto-4-pentenoate hydratase/2-oxohepta-3-ene-1,7-dioic acid hydratase in catechol pathway